MRLARALALLLALPVAAAQDAEKDTLAGMDAEVRGDWIEAAQAFARAAEAAPGDLRKGLRLRLARQRGIAFWKPQIDLLLKEKRLEDAARAVMIAGLIEPGNAAVASAARTLEKAGVKVPNPPPANEPVSKLFPNRSAAGRLRAWSTLGAPFGRASKLIDDGTRFLIAAQGPKGNWEAKKHGGYEFYDTGVTAIALLALLVDGSGGLSGDRAVAARHAADYIAESEDDGGRKQAYCVMLASEALAEYAAISGETERLLPTLERARDLIVNAQNPGGGWQYKPRDGNSDTSVTARAVYALHALRRTGIAVPEQSLRDAMAWVDSMVGPEYGQIGYKSPDGAPARLEDKQDLFPVEHTQSMTAAGTLAACYVGTDRAWVRRCLALMSEVPPQGRYPDMYYWEVGARAWVAATGKVHLPWYAALVDAAAACARPDGGMDACDPWGEEGGRIYATGMTVLALAAPFSESPPKDRGASASAFLGSGTRDVVVPAYAAETPTGIYAEPGMSVFVTARGTIQPWADSPRVPPDGIKHDFKSRKPLLRSAPFGCLVGKIGPEGKPFRIQMEKQFAFGACGQLFLFANDDRPEDGTGEWSVCVRLDR